ncbi:hypothetical protein [Microcoleus sp. FACHB-672]|nr:hypothetical protein [Microcoleus sp. FACHB-672]MBD2043211.1 hypothetical protein [Microcoleus sp. FACHB-672]
MSATVTGTDPIAKADHYGLLATALDKSIASEYFTAIDRLLYSLRRGRI